MILVSGLSWRVDDHLQSFVDIDVARTAYSAPVSIGLAPRDLVNFLLDVVRLLMLWLPRQRRKSFTFILDLF